ncbi:WD40 repeat domain-containing protein [Streptomyces sp. NPDC057403]|uniref:WD40 repeat domain-containing protein n=1 Tax=Streptomyces sp. NPDC057403 TaxID=3346119 RepID=UPI0036B60E27
MDAEVGEAPGGGALPQGSLATLTVEVLPGGPAGLFPDPRTMAFFAADTAFQDALTEAWAYAQGPRQDLCVLWALTLNGEPYLRVRGNSLGLALAVVLHELFDHAAGARRRLNPGNVFRMLRNQTAVTGALDRNGTVAPVDGVPEKLGALAGKGPFTAIVPSANRASLAGHAIPDTVDVHWAPDVTAARRAARRLNRRRILTTGLVIAACTALTASLGLYAVHRSNVADRRDHMVSALVQQANAKDTVNPPLGSLLALQSNAQQASERTQGAVLNAIAKTGTLTHTLAAHSGAATGAALVTVGGHQYSVTAGVDGVLRTWDTATGKSVYEADQAEGGRILTLAVSPTVPGQLVVGGTDGATLWQLGADGRLSGRNELPVGAETSTESVVDSAAFSPDGSTVALGYADGVVQLFSSQGELRSPRFFGLSGTVRGLAYSTDGRTLYAGTATNARYSRPKGFLYSMDPTNPTAPRPLELHPGQHGGISALALVKPLIDDQDHDRLLIGTPEGLQSWDPATGEDTAPFPVGNTGSHDVTAITSSALLIAVQSGSSVHLLDRDDLTDAESSYAGDDGPVAFNEAGDTLLTANGGTVYQWALDRDPLAAGPQVSATATAMAYDASGALFTTDNAGNLTRYPARGGDLRHSTVLAELHTGASRSLAVTRAHGRELAAVADWRSAAKGRSDVNIVDIATRKVLPTPQLAAATAQCSGVRAITFTPDGSRLVTACWNSGPVTEWDTRTWRRVASADVPGFIQSLAVTPDGSTVVAGTAPENVAKETQQNAVWFLHARDLTRVSVPRAAHPGGVLAITASSGRIYTVGYEGKVRVWTTSGRPLAMLSPANVAYSAAVLPRAKLLAVSTSNGLAFYALRTLHRVGGFVPITTPGDADHQALRLTTDPTGRYLAGVLGISTDFGPPETWLADPADWTAELCRSAGRDLTAAEWRTYGADGFPARSVCRATLASPTTPSAKPSPTQKLQPSLVPTTGPAVPSGATGDCKVLLKGAKGTCALFGDGYAWVQPKPTMNKEFTIDTAEITVYHRSGDAWTPVVGTAAKAGFGVIHVATVPTSSGGSALAVLLSAQNPRPLVSLAVVDQGRIASRADGEWTRLRVTGGQLHAYAPAYAAEDPDCCPSGAIEQDITRDAASTWSLSAPTAVPLKDLTN